MKNPSSSLEFCEAGIRDQALVLELLGKMREFFQEPFNRERLESTLKQFLREEWAGRIWLVKAKGKTIGYVILTLGFSFEFLGRDAFIDELYLLPKHRSKGYGKEIIDFVCEQAKSRFGVSAIHLEVSPDNDQANRLYTKIGFEFHSNKLMTKWLV